LAAGARTKTTNGAKNLESAEFYILEQAKTSGERSAVTEEHLRQMPAGAVVFARHFDNGFRELAEHYGLFTEEMARRVNGDDAAYSAFVIERVALWTRGWRG